MIEYKGIGWDAEMDCRDCGTTEYAYVPENGKRDKEIFGHRECSNYNMNFKRRFISIDTDARPPLWGCDCCAE